MSRNLSKFKQGDTSCFSSFINIIHFCAWFLRTAREFRVNQLEAVPRSVKWRVTVWHFCAGSCGGVNCFLRLLEAAWFFRCFNVNTLKQGYFYHNEVLFKVSVFPFVSIRADGSSTSDAGCHGDSPCGLFISENRYVRTPLTPTREISENLRKAFLEQLGEIIWLF